MPSNPSAVLVGVLSLLMIGAQPVQAQQSVITLDPQLLDSEPLPPTTPATEQKKLPDNIKSLLPDEDIRTDFPVAVLQGLNKVTAKTTTLTAPMDVTVFFGTLAITPKKCWKAPPGERPENAVLLEILDSKPDAGEAVVFSGWMFSSSPAISALEHPVYDITMLDCIAQ